MKRHGSGPMGGDGGQGSSPRKGVDSARRRLDAEGRWRSEAAEALADPGGSGASRGKDTAFFCARLVHS